MKKLSLFILIFASFLSCKKQESGSQSSSASPNFQSGSCSIGKWASTPIALKMSSEFVGDYTNADLVGGLNPLEQMAKVWNDAVTPQTTLLTVPFSSTATTGYSTLSSFRDSEFGIYKSHNWFTGVSSNALAITQFYGIMRSDSGLGTYIDLTHADLIFNYRDFAADFSFSGNPFDYDVPTVLLHELGHFLGLCHETAHTSIMAPYYMSTSRSLKTWDTNKIKGLYLNNQNIMALSTQVATNALTVPVGTEVKGIVELNADGMCRHYINGKVVYEHGTNLGKLPGPRWYRNLPLRK
jgi:hypothetical protein